MKLKDKENRLTLVHSVNTWLPLTESWIFTQVKNITQLQQLVLADTTNQSHPILVQTKISPSIFCLRFYKALKSRLGLPDFFRRFALFNLKGKSILLSHYGTRGYQDLNLVGSYHIVRFYGFDLQRIYQSDPVWKWRYALLFEKANVFVVEGEFMARELVKMGCPMRKIWVQYLGVELNQYPFKQRNPVKPVLNVLIAAAFAERKGIIFALKAIADYKNLGNKIHVHFVGARISDYPHYIAYEREIEQLIVDQKMESYMTRYGLVDSIFLQKIASQCHVLIHPSVWAADGDSEGGYPLVIAEMMATGLPVITTPHCDIPQLVNDFNGWLCRERNVEDILNALIEINDDIILRKGSIARKWVEENFDASKLGKQFEKRLITLANNG